MNAFIRFTQTTRYPIGWMAGIVLLVAISIMTNSGKCLKTSNAPAGIVSLELTYRAEKAERIKNQWINTQCADGRIADAQEKIKSGNAATPVITVARNNIWLDFIFIAVYCSCAVVWVVRKNGRTVPTVLGRRVRMVLVAVCLAGALDGVENIFMLQFLADSSTHPILFALPATLKFALLMMVAVYILARNARIISSFAEGFTATLWNNRVSVLGLLVIYFALWKSDQGQDLLLNLNANDIGPGVFYVILTVLAAHNWYLPKYCSNDFINRFPANRGLAILFQNPVCYAKGNEANVPRILGILTFLIPACAILNALDTMQINYATRFISPMLLLIGSTLVYIWIIHEDFIEKGFHWLQERKKGWVFFAMITLMLVIILLFGVVNKNAPHQLANLSIGLYLMSFIFATIITLRVQPDFYKIPGLEKILRWFQRQMASRWVIAGGACAIFIFIMVNVIPVIFSSWSWSRFLTLPVVFTGISFYTVFFFLLIILGRYTKINWAAIVIILAMVMAIYNDNQFHDIARSHRGDDVKLEKMEQYIDHWVTERQSEILKSDQYPVFIVNTYGGGIRAAAWTSLVVSHLDKASEGKFQRHVFAYSGASGGTIGASVMCALRKSQDGKPMDPEKMVEFYKNDFLTPVLVGLIGRDVLFSTTGLNAVDDRSRLQDNIWETHLCGLGSGEIYSKEFCSLWYDSLSKKKYDIPLLFANTYHIESGLKGILAPVQLNPRHFPQAVDINQKLEGNGIALSTGSFLSARFPYISPAGKLDNTHHFLDGGLKENSGAETALELYTSLKDHIDDRERSYKNRQQNSKEDSLRYEVYRKIHVYFLSLNNTGTDEIKATTSNLVELTAPVTALYNNWVGNTLKADSVLRKQTGTDYFQLRPLKDSISHEGITFKPVLPLGWQISDFALRRLHESLTYCNIPKSKSEIPNPKKINKILGLLGDYKVPCKCDITTPKPVNDVVVSKR
jgi:hypothetical protein